MLTVLEESLMSLTFLENRADGVEGEYYGAIQIGGS
jgi:hypothetical protein